MKIKQKTKHVQQLLLREKLSHEKHLRKSTLDRGVGRVIILNQLEDIVEVLNYLETKD